MPHELYDWLDRFKHEGMSAGLRLELLELLKPYVSFKAPFRMFDRDEAGEPVLSSARIKDVVDWEIVLGAEDFHDVVKDLRGDRRWKASLPELLPYFTTLLLDCLDLMRQLEGADERSDMSYVYQPSIAEHPQNQSFRQWTILIDLTRDALLTTIIGDRETARSEVLRWLTYSYPLFRRLAFFAGAETNLFRPEESVCWLFADNNWWLWSVETQREALRLLTKLAPLLGILDEESILTGILSGPPRNMFREDVGSERFARILDREVWLRLAKYKAASGRELPRFAAERLASISKRFPQWQLAPDERDEFPVWTGKPEDFDKPMQSPKDIKDLEEWLRIDRGEIAGDDWDYRCKTDIPTAVGALLNLASRGEWPVRRWRTALQVWSDNSLVNQSWLDLKATLQTVNDTTLKALLAPLCWWLQAVGKVLVDDLQVFFELIRRTLLAQKDVSIEATDDFLFKAINHPIGQATDAVLRWWFRQDLKDNQGLKDEPRSIFLALTDVSISSYRYGRIILFRNLIPLFRVDRIWTERHLLPLLQWQRYPEEALAAWTGFLWSPSFYIPVLAAIKPAFIETAKHYNQLGKIGGQYATLLTYTALEAPEAFTKKELASATEQLPPEALSRCARALSEALDSAGDKRAEYWRNRVHPYIQQIWPKSSAVMSESISNSFARLAIKAGEAFPEAVAEIRPWLGDLRRPSMNLYSFGETGLASRFPDASLTFLDGVVPPGSVGFTGRLGEYLLEIQAAKPELQDDPRFKRLDVLARQFGR